MNERIKLIRKKLNINQNDFGKAIGISRDAVSNIELNRVEIKEYMVKLICREFNVNEDWLRNGGSDEDMFNKYSKDEEIAMYVQDLLDSEDDDIVANAIKEFIVIYEKLNDDSKAVLQNTAKEFLKKLQEQN